MTSFREKMKSRSSLKNIKNQIERAQNRRYIEDGFWEIENPKKNSLAETKAWIRFMPAPEGEDTPWISYSGYDIFLGKGRVYRERALFSLDPNASDPVNEMNKVLHAEGRHKEAFNSRKFFVCNIFVEKDFQNPENDGKVFKFRYGPQIHKMLMEASGLSEVQEDKKKKESSVEAEEDIMDESVEKSHERPLINPWCLFAEDPDGGLGGQVFVLTSHLEDGIANYKKSKFAKMNPAKIPENLRKHYTKDGWTRDFLRTDEEREAVYNSLYSLKEEESEDNYKSYEELEKLLIDVLGPEKALLGRRNKNGGGQAQPSNNTQQESHQSQPSNALDDEIPEFEDEIFNLDDPSTSEQENVGSHLADDDLENIEVGGQETDLTDINDFDELDDGFGEDFYQGFADDTK